jgi:hypothetical protein
VQDFTQRFQVLHHPGGELAGEIADRIGGRAEHVEAGADTSKRDLRPVSLCDTVTDFLACFDCGEPLLPAASFDEFVAHRVGMLVVNVANIRAAVDQGIGHFAPIFARSDAAPLSMRW